MDNIELDFTAARQTSVGRKAIDGKGFEPEVADLLLWLFHDSRHGLFIDVGSNIGYFPLMLGQYAKLRGLDLLIYAHEPLPLLQELSRELQRVNDVPYNLRGSALSDSVGTADFYVSSVSDSSNSLVAGFRKEKEVITVQLNTLDNAYLRLFDSEAFDVSVVMIDVETAEPAVLRGARKAIMKHRPTIICEVLAGRTEKDISEFLASVDYSAYRFDGAEWVLETTLFGDRTYRYRDWMFLPAERAATLGARIVVPSLGTVVAAKK
jgi:FkbM family methyltransferase